VGGGSDDTEGVSLSLLKRMPWAHLAYNFSSEVSTWFIDFSSEKTSSISSSDGSSSGKSEESSSPLSPLVCYRRFLAVEDFASSSILCLSLSLDAIIWTSGSLERGRE
jgi:hypothetical protein